MALSAETESSSLLLVLQLPKDAEVSDNCIIAAVLIHPLLGLIRDHGRAHADLAKCQRDYLNKLMLSHRARC